MQFPPYTPRFACKDLRVVELIRHCEGAVRNKKLPDSASAITRQGAALAGLRALRDNHGSLHWNSPHVGDMEATKSLFGPVAMRLATVIALTVLMLAAGFLLWPRVSFWQQHRLAIGMVAKLEQAKSPNSRALRQIATIGYPAIDSLILAAASEQTQIALEAREIVEERLAAWKNRSVADEDFSLIVPVSILASALAEHVDALGPHGQQWASKLSLELVDLAAAMPAAEAVQLLADCSTVMSAVTPLGPRMRTLSSGNSSSPSNETALPLPSMKLPHLASEQAMMGNEGLLDLPFPSMANELATPLEPSDSTDMIPLPRDSSWIPEWSRQAPFASNSNPVDELPQTGSAIAAPTDPVLRIPSPDEMATLFQKLRLEETAGLLNRIASSDHYTAAVIRSVLKERGIGSEELSLAVRLAAADAAERLELVDELKVLPARTARRWLRELLTDKNADVRLKALTAMATTNDPELIGIAREVAVQDSDSRVTELAARIIREAR